MIRKSAVLLLLGVAMCVGCATRGVNTVAISSNPEGAKAYVNGRYIGETPCRFPQKWWWNNTTQRGYADSINIKLVKEGFKSVERTIHHTETYNRWVSGDFSAGSEFGYGGTYTYSFILEQK